MRFHERPQEERQHPGAPMPAGSGPDGPDLDQVRRQAEALLHAGDEAIRRALSRDSEQFLTASRQQGGQ